MSSAVHLRVWRSKVDGGESSLGRVLRYIHGFYSVAVCEITIISPCLRNKKHFGWPGPCSTGVVGFQCKHGVDVPQNSGSGPLLIFLPLGRIDPCFL